MLDDHSKLGVGLKASNVSALVEPVVLVLDDDPGMREALQFLLSDAYQVLLASTWREAFQMLRTQPVDVFISDYRMPEKDGLQVMSEAKEAFPAVIKILISGALETDAVLDAFNSGLIARFVVKPWNDQELLVLIRELLDRRHVLAENQRLLAATQMVAGVAHEINTPLGVAITGISMVRSLASQIAPCSNDPAMLEEVASDLKEAVDLVFRNLQRAADLVASFKDLAAGRVSEDATSVDLYALVADAVRVMELEMDKARITVALAHAPDDKAEWTGFPKRLTQVVVILIHNVARYAYDKTQGGKVDVRVSRIDSAQGPQYRIEVEDYGKGIAPSVRPRLFEPFVTTGRAIGGSGLGLAVAKNIVTNMLKGSINCLSEEGKGTRFVINLPQCVPDVGIS